MTFLFLQHGSPFFLPPIYIPLAWLHSVLFGVSSPPLLSSVTLLFALRFPLLWPESPGLHDQAMVSERSPDEHSVQITLQLNSLGGVFSCPGCAALHLAGITAAGSPVVLSSGTLSAAAELYLGVGCSLASSSFCSLLWSGLLMCQ